MRIRAIYVGKTYAFGTKELIEYAIVNERELSDTDIVVLGMEPNDGKRKFADPSRGWLEIPAWEVRDRLLIISGRPRRAATAPLIRLDDVRVEKHIMANEAVEALLKKAEELTKRTETGVEVFSDEDRMINVNGINFMIMRIRPPESVESLQNTLLNIYHVIASPRKRVFVAAPAFVEIMTSSESGWYVVTIPKVLHFLRQNVEALVQVGVIDPGGFNTPYLVVKGMTPEDLGTVEDQRSNVDWLDRILRAGARPGAAGVGVGVAGTEEVSPFT